MNETLFGFHFEYDDTERFEYFNGCVTKHLQMVKVFDKGGEKRRRDCYRTTSTFS